MKFKPKYFLIILPVLVGMFLALNANLSHAGCNSGDIYQMITESKKCETIGCLTHYLNKLNACKAATEAKKEKAAEEAAGLQKEVSSLESSISEKNASIASLNSEIANLQYQIEKTSKEIEKIEKRMAKNKKTIEVALKSFYEYDKENIVTIILSQSNFSDFFDEVFYVESVQKKVAKIVEQLKKDKKELKEKKKELAASKETLEAKRNKLATERNILAQEKAEQASLLGSAQSKESGYKNLLEKVKSERTIMTAELRRLIEQSMASSSNVSTGGTGGYPWAGRCNGLDDWFFYRCECTSYAAWKWDTWGYKFGEQSIPYVGERNAKNWPNIASKLGYGTGSTPQVKAIISWPWGNYGHVAIVEKVYANGSIRISEYNAVPYSYSARNVSPNNYAGATFIYAP